MKKTTPRNSLNIGGVLSEFQETEKSKAHRKGTFKIEAPFEKAIDTILKAMPESKPRKPSPM